MKKIFTLVAMAMMAVGANAQTVIAEKDWSGVTDDALPWIQFAGEEGAYNGSAKGGADGIEITVNEKSGQLWQPQANVLEGFDLSVDENYQVVVTAKLPCDGQLQINMGDWGVNFQYDFPVTATGDFQEIVCDFPEYGGDATGAHVLFQCGDFLGTSIVKSVKVLQLGGDTPEPPAGDEVIAEKDWSGVADDALPWIQFAGEEGAYNGSAKGGADGIEITVTEDVGQLWQPQANIVEGFDLSVDENYLVVVNAKMPCDGQLQINMGDWGVNFQYDFPVAATGDFQDIECEFPEYGGDATGAHVLFQCGNFVGTSIVKSVKVLHKGTSGIKNVKATKANSARYNLAGQKVDANYKGIVIQNGKKFIQK